METEEIIAYRPLMFAIAYRMLGGVADAEDAVQETFLRWHRALATGTVVEAPKAWLSTVVTRLCLDELKSARATREAYVGPWLPEPIVGDTGAVPDVADVVAQADTLSTAFLLLLERLSPKERAAFLLHDVFGYEHAEVARVIGESDAYARQLARRARAHVAEGRPRFPASETERERLTDRFVRACADGDLSELVATLAEDVTVWSDGGGKVNAARKPIHGRAKVAPFLLGLMRLAPPGTYLRQATVNGQRGVVTYVGGQPFNVATFDVADGAIRGIYVVANPDKLGGVAPFSDGRPLTPGPSSQESGASDQEPMIRSQ